ncbi:MAG: 1-(5-phosphoribosyl)-5-[(5-phosphoribosylamino)methylideneamino]imidazole-4-carboxamide isomerase [Endomicrobia bacterium]|nr:1-(5-phosphoribosyl)-5-[(5-phosphoribosylamino)methylideneamino]imidazole-4-carboxamide isomerase [Endomicrobiia bacterium]MDW8055938.1 1-(5-phosphoribosyl)-5-[(5-phosphoribosylamino)methylideneamino]imidazole-4-carboxamide isomerase [Elusimicrobiota bacterium]
MLIIPAVDLHQGKCVRLTQGRLDQEIVYSNDPVFIARLWQSRGAKLLHLIDLDGAYVGCVQHWSIIRDIRKSLSIPIQFGGGVRNFRTVKELDKIGVDRIIISTVIINNPDEAKKIITEFKGKIIAAVDIKEDKLAIGGWKEEIPIDIKEYLQKISQLGIKEIILTDIDREGLLQGFGYEKIKGLLEEIKNFGFEVILSGGITSLADIEKVKALKEYKVKGVIIGKALYAETIIFEEAMKVAEM